MAGVAQDRFNQTAGGRVARRAHGSDGGEPLLAKEPMAGGNQMMAADTRQMDGIGGAEGGKARKAAVAEHRQRDDAAQRIADPVDGGRAGVIEQFPHVRGEARHGQCRRPERPRAGRAAVTAQIRHQHAIAKTRKDVGIGSELARRRREAMAKHDHLPVGGSEIVIDQPRAVAGQKLLVHARSFRSLHGTKAGRC